MFQVIFKEDHFHFVYQFFNNATVAALLAVLLATRIASVQYKKQKAIDRLSNEKNKIIDLLSEIYQAVEEVLFIYDRATRTLLSTEFTNSKSTDREQILKTFQERINYLEMMQEGEIPRISILLNEKIPLLNKRIVSYINLYFLSYKNVMLLHGKFNQSLKDWHDFVINNMGTENINFLKYSSEIYRMSPDVFKESTNELIKEVSKVE